MCIWRWRCGAASVLRRRASGCFRLARSVSRGRRWRPCWLRRDFASRRASCTLPRIGIAARRFAICSNSAERRSTRIGSIAALDHLLAGKAALEAHLSQRCGELFAVANEVLLYDVTSTYFEGLAEANPQAQRGYSRDHRPDCRQVCIALVVTFDGFPLGYEVFAGNTHDLRTLQTIVAAMEARHGALGRVWIADRGMASAENLAWLRSTGRRYIIGAPKSELKEVRLCARRFGRLAHGSRRRRGQARPPSRDRRDRDPVSLGRPARQTDLRQCADPSL